MEKRTCNLHGMEMWIKGVTGDRGGVGFQVVVGGEEALNSSFFGFIQIESGFYDDDWLSGEKIMYKTVLYAYLGSIFH